MVGHLDDAGFRSGRPKTTTPVPPTVGNTPVPRLSCTEVVTRWPRRARCLFRRSPSNVTSRRRDCQHPFLRSSSVRPWAPFPPQNKGWSPLFPQKGMSSSVRQFHPCDTGHVTCPSLPPKGRPGTRACARAWTGLGDPRPLGKVKLICCPGVAPVGTATSPRGQPRVGAWRGRCGKGTVYWFLFVVLVGPIYPIWFLKKMQKTYQVWIRIGSFT